MATGKNYLAANNKLPATSRRCFIKALSLSGGALLIGSGLTIPVEAAKEISQDTNGLAFNAFLKITPDNRVIVVIKHLDKGQGVTTGLSTIVAEELDADWQQVGWEFAPADAKRYNNLFWGPVQSTGGSTSIANSWQQLREAGAAAREMFVKAAAEKWQVDTAAVSVQNGVVSAGKYSANFGELLELAAKQAPPEAPTLKAPDKFTLIGQSLPRIDSLEKTTGKAVYTQDIQLPGMLTALIVFPPKLGGVLLSFDDKAAKKIAGFIGAVKISRGVAVVAENYWSAKKARDVISAKWDLSACETRSSDALFQDYAALAAKPGTVVSEKGDAATVIADESVAGSVVEMEFHVPYLAHAAMEPMNCVAKVEKKHCELWYGAQAHTFDQNEIAGLLSIAPENVKINTLFAGGSFGRRACTSDYVIDAVEVAQHFQGKPIKMLFTREDDMQAGRYRPMAVHKVTGKVTTKGKLLAWQHHAVSQTIMRGTPFGTWFDQPIEPPITEGFADLPYATDNLSVQGTEVKTPITGLWWRSVGHSGNAFVVETFVDQLAFAAKKDPLEFRRALLKGDARRLGVLNLAAEKADWGSALPKGKARGIAVHKAMGSWVAEVAEVSIQDKTLHVEKVVCAIDCGIAINPDVIKAQMEGSIGFALGAVLGEQLTIEEGAVAESNFHQYFPLRFNQMPEVEVYIVPSAEAPSGVGEPGVPPLTPAVANAVFALTGQPVSALPIKVS